jgi:hypothetical protein
MFRDPIKPDFATIRANGHVAQTNQSNEGIMPYADEGNRPMDEDRVKDRDGKLGTVRGVSLHAGGAVGYV